MKKILKMRATIRFARMARARADLTVPCHEKHPKDWIDVQFLGCDAYDGFYGFIVQFSLHAPFTGASSPYSFP
jgi:hypothetical protein